MRTTKKTARTLDAQAVLSWTVPAWIPSPAPTEAEREAYEDLYPYITKAVKTSEQAR